MITKKATTAKVNNFFKAKGGRKTANANARVSSGKLGLTVNGKDYKEYFKISKHQLAALAPLELLSLKDAVGASVHVRGGGINAQAEAVRNAVARALVALDSAFKKALRQAGYLTRDARMVERKKYGLKKARRAPQWSKR